MTLIKFKKGDPAFHPALSDFFDDFLSPAVFNGGRVSMPAVNISEAEDKYHVEFSAPGFKKEDFDVKVENETLTVSAEFKAEKEGKEKNYSRKEFSFGSFKRSFSLPESVNANAIQAQYENGILKIDLPKKEETQVSPARQIKIS
ncbi:MAG: Hsp20/alpha crystallin family protein [Flavobacteriales bacterium]|nr:Hsp20/alpha crystallin family protein [Flavobacteriales bacterium]MCB9447716.1 Hsp20/alpha crystallin family protein [Flavobacteriales bacterium]